MNGLDGAGADRGLSVQAKTVNWGATMATIEQVRDAMHRQPFLGFTVHLTDGKSYHVKHPDFISVPQSARGRDMFIHERDATHRIDILHVVRLEEPPGPDSNADGKGAGRRSPRPGRPARP